MYECPICGKSSNRRGDPFETEQQVIAHVDGSHDDDHEDIRGEDIRGDIAEVSVNATGYGSEGTSRGSSEREDDSPSQQNRTSEQVSTTGGSEDSDDTGRTAEMKSDAATDDREAVEMTPDEIDDIYQAGRTEGKQETTNSDESGNVGESGVEYACWSCGEDNLVPWEYVYKGGFTCGRCGQLNEINNIPTP